jgi:hypothetical protein
MECAPYRKNRYENTFKLNRLAHSPYLDSFVWAPQLRLLKVQKEKLTAPKETLEPVGS